eukprot:3866846-Amphidinium_carterae.1
MRQHREVSTNTPSEEETFENHREDPRQEKEQKSGVTSRTCFGKWPEADHANHVEMTVHAT